MSTEENEYDTPEIPEVFEEEYGDAPEVSYIDDIRRFESAMRSIFSGRQTREQELADIAKAKDGNIAARNHILAANAYVIVMVVKGVVKKRVLPLLKSIEISDLLQEGQFGIYDAIKRFQEKKNVRFASYAYFRVLDYVLIAVGNSYTLSSTPRAISKKLAFLKKRRNEVAAKLRREPSWNELLSGLSPAEQSRLIQIELLARSVSPDGAALFEEILTRYAPDAQYLAMLESVSDREDMERLQQLIANPKILDKRKRRILEARYMSGGERVVGFEEIAAQEGCSESRICQLHGEAVMKLRQCA